MGNGMRLTRLVGGKIRSLFEVNHSQKAAKNIRDTSEELTFIEAVRECISQDVRNGPGANLMPIGKLRLLKQVNLKNETHAFNVNLNFHS